MRNPTLVINLTLLSDKTQRATKYLNINIFGRVTIHNCHSAPPYLNADVVLMINGCLLLCALLDLCCVVLFFLAFTVQQVFSLELTQVLRKGTMSWMNKVPLQYLYLLLLQMTRDGRQKEQGCCVLTTDLMLLWLLDAVGVGAFGSGSVSISSPQKNSLSFWTLRKTNRIRLMYTMDG